MDSDETAPIEAIDLGLHKLTQRLLQYFCEVTKVDDFCCLFVLLLNLPSQLVMAGRSAHLATLFLGKLEQAVNQYFMHILSLVTDNNLS